MWANVPDPVQVTKPSCTCGIGDNATTGNKRVRIPVVSHKRDRIASESREHQNFLGSFPHGFCIDFNGEGLENH